MSLRFRTVVPRGLGSGGQVRDCLPLALVRLDAAARSLQEGRKSANVHASPEGYLGNPGFDDAASRPSEPDKTKI